MLWKIAAAPVVGALIGYLTNWIAVKMLFHPRHEIRIRGHKLPMTPGVIPKGQPRLARAIGNVVQTQLLTEEVMKEILLSREMKDKLEGTVRRWMEEKKSSEKLIRDTALELTDKESLHELSQYAGKTGAEYILQRVKKTSLIRRLTEKIMEAAQEKLGESIIGMMIGGGFLETIREAIEEKLVDYIDTYGQEYLENIIVHEMKNLSGKTVGESIALVDNNDFRMETLVLEIYERVIGEHIGQIMASLNLSRIVEDRINSMEVEEVEKLVLSIMKKELGTIVNLGAVIGFILGLFNVLIMLI